MSAVNVWVAISATAQTQVKARLTHDFDSGDYTGPVTDTEAKIFRRMADRATVQRMFKTPTLGGKQWNIYSLYFEASKKARDAFDFLAANRANHFVIVGAWHWDGRQVGTQWELDQDGERTGNTTGTPLYPIHARLIDFMPDEPILDQNGDITGWNPASGLSDINLIQGQAPRRFTA